MSNEGPPQTPKRQTSEEDNLLSSPLMVLKEHSKMDTIPSLQFDEIPLEMPPPRRSPGGGLKRNSFTSTTTSPMYRNDNLSNGSINNQHQNKRHSLNYIPSLSQPPPPSQTFISHSHSNSQSSARRLRSPIRSKSPIRSPSPVRITSPIRGGVAGGNPFNFKSTPLMMQHGNGSQNSLNVPALNKTQYRRGHRYKHSSVSMNLFQEPPKRAPLNIPQNYSIPTFKEVLKSLQFIQKIKLIWCLLHTSLIIIIFITGLNFNNSLLLTLSHLCFYDVLSNLIVVIVDVMTNFDCWNNSSLQYPFGLGRIEVLIGFGLSVSLIFVGGDLVSHLLEELIIKLIIGDTNNNEDRIHHSHSDHHDDSNSLSGFHFEVLNSLIIVITLISSNLLLSLSENAQNAQNAQNTQNAQNSFKFFNKNYLINNSTNFLTLSYASYSLFYPLLSKLEIFESINDLFTLLLAILMSTMAWKLIKSLSYILLISYPYDSKSFNNTISKLTDEIHKIDDFKNDYKIDKIIISKVNYKIFIVILQLQMYGCTDEDESKIRFYTTRVIKKILTQEETGEFDELNDSIDQSGSKFEITIDINRL